RSALDRREALARVGGSIERRVARVHDVGVPRVGGDAAEVPPAVPDAAVAADVGPACTFVVRTVEASLRRVDDRVDARRPRWRHGKADAPDTFGEAVAFDRRPSLA